MDPTLTVEQQAALEAIRDAPEAWSWAEALKGEARDLALSLIRPGVPDSAIQTWLAGLHTAGHSADVLSSLADLGHLEPFTLGVGLAWTLTPWGAATLGVHLVERWEFELAREERWLGREYRQDEEGGWILIDRFDEVIVRRPDEAAYWTTAPPRKVRLPRRCGESPLQHPELVPAVPDEPADDECPAATRARVAATFVVDEEGEPLRLFAGGKQDQGVKVQRDRRLKPPRRAG